MANSFGSPIFEEEGDPVADREGVRRRADAARVDAARLRGICPTCGHEAHRSVCAQSIPLGHHWVTCGCEAS